MDLKTIGKIFDKLCLILNMDKKRYLVITHKDYIPNTLIFIHFPLYPYQTHNYRLISKITDLILSSLKRKIISRSL